MGVLRAEVPGLLLAEGKAQSYVQESVALSVHLVDWAASLPRPWGPPFILGTATNLISNVLCNEI